MGVSYSSQTAVVRLEHNVAMEMIPANGNAEKAAKQPSDRNSPLIAGVPVTATSRSLELRRNERVVVAVWASDHKTRGAGAVRGKDIDGA